jgi:hypothetical protein
MLTTTQPILHRKQSCDAWVWIHIAHQGTTNGTRMSPTSKLLFLGRQAARNREPWQACGQVLRNLRARGP